MQRNQQPHAHYDSLDALRGIAAVIVLLFHLVVLSHYDLWTPINQTYLLRPLVAGASSVTVFFVLSGFVLYLSMQKAQEVNFGQYTLKRALRLLPVYLVVMAFATPVYLAIGGSPLEGMSDEFSKQWTSPVDPAPLYCQLLLLCSADHYTIDTPTWSLMVELRISLFFPLLAWFVSSGGRRFAALALFAAVGFFAFHVLQIRDDYDLVKSWSCLAYFLAGALMAKYRSEGQALARKIPAPLAWLGFVMLVYAMTIQQERLFGLATAMAAIGVVFMTANFAPIARLVTSRTTLYLGRISYPLYLVHLPILMTSYIVLDGVLNRWLIMLLIIPCSIVAADVLHRYVEAPAMKLGRTLVGRRPDVVHKMV